MGRGGWRNTRSGRILESTAESQRRAKWAASADRTRAEGEFRGPPQSVIGERMGVSADRT